MLIPALDENKIISLRNSQHHPTMVLVCSSNRSEIKNDFTTLQENCVLGSSIIAKMYDDAHIPLDVAIRGSSALEKLLTSMNKKKLKSLILRNGTNNVTKSSKKGKDLFTDYKKLVAK